MRSFWDPTPDVNLHQNVGMGLERAELYLIK